SSSNPVVSGSSASSTTKSKPLFLRCFSAASPVEAAVMTTSSPPSSSINSLRSCEPPLPIKSRFASVLTASSTAATASPAAHSTDCTASACSASTCPLPSASTTQKEKVLPSPSVLRTVISPSNSAAICRQIESPRPVPPYLRLVVPSACWNASKIS